MKIARAATGRPAVLAFEDGFHGRTLLALSLTSKVHPYKAGFGPFAPEVYRAPYGYCYRCSYNLEYPACGSHCVDALEDVFKRYVEADKVAAVIVEPVLGEGGFVVPPRRLAAAPSRADRRVTASCSSRTRCRRASAARASSSPSSTRASSPTS